MDLRTGRKAASRTSRHSAQPSSRRQQPQRGHQTPSERRQQTLTQIDFVSRKTEEEDLDLHYIQPGSPKPKRKKRKTTHTGRVPDNTLTQINFVTRIPLHDEDEIKYIHNNDDLQPIITTMPAVGGSSSARVNPGRTSSHSTPVKKSPGLRRQSANSPNKRNGSIVRARAPSDEYFSPFAAPRRVFKQEIASSQSPEGSPASVKLQTPLQESATNIQTEVNKIVDKSPAKFAGEARGLDAENINPLSLEDTVLNENVVNVRHPGHSKVVKLEIEDSDEELDLGEEENSPKPGMAFTAPDEHSPIIKKEENIFLPSNNLSALSNARPNRTTDPTATRNDSTMSPNLRCRLPRGYRDGPQEAGFRENSRCSSVQGSTQLPIPTSQLSTVDMSQSSPRSARSNGQTIPTSSTTAARSSPIDRSDTKTIEEGSPECDISNPSSAIETETSMTNNHRWDGKVLTDSQLLPESIMGFELSPASTQYGSTGDTQ